MYSGSDTWLSPGGFPHSDIFGSAFFANSPKLFAGSHDFLRLLPPRHPSYALILLDHIISNSLCISVLLCCIPQFFFISLFKEHYYKLFQNL